MKLVCGHVDEVVGVALSSDGLLLATCCRDGCVGIWNMENLEQKVVFLAPKKVEVKRCLKNFTFILGMSVHCICSTSSETTPTCVSTH